MRLAPQERRHCLRRRRSSSRSHVSQAFALFDGNTRLRGARVPINRALPPAWWPRDPDSVSLLAACVGGPLVIGAGAAVLLFR